MADESKVIIEIDGVEVEAPKGGMLIDVTDANNIDVPRFCYHRKLSVAANCRMCLVEVERAPKPMPACATPINEGMKVWTKSAKARAAQKGTMEFLLINHPLDCPICDQGGECELQDLAMGYGRDVSQYSEGKRVVPNPDIGSLISTDMTRCIHCTRCVRFGQEIAGIRELGATGRGEHTTIGTYIKHAVASEMSGNVIDLCPVGALTSKPYRFTARPWELRQSSAVSPHDAVGSNLWLHTRGNKVMRTVPRDNEAVNEVWISDRDRFGYLGIHSEDRLTTPQIRRDGVWESCDWSIALNAAANGLRAALRGDPAQLGVLGAGNATVEELYLLQKVARGLGSNNIDHRLGQGDFSAQAADPLFPWLGQSLAQLDTLQAALVIGSNLRKGAPIVGHRMRKSVQAGGVVALLNPVDYEMNFPVAQTWVRDPAAMVAELAAIASVAAGEGLAADYAALASAVDESHRTVVDALRSGENTTVLIGELAQAHASYGLLCALARIISDATGSRLGFLPAEANRVGGMLAGAVPHRRAAGTAQGAAGLDARAMFDDPRNAYLLLGVEPAFDCWDPATALKSLDQADCVVALTAYASEELLAVADVLLPVATFAETAGTFVNAAGDWQSWSGAVSPPGEARPAWKVLRVLGNEFEIYGFEYHSAEEVRDELREACAALKPDNTAAREIKLDAPAATEGLLRIGETPMYAKDSLVRRAGALQRAADAVSAVVRLSPADAERLGLDAGPVTVEQGDQRVVMPLEIDVRIPAGAAWIPTAVPGTSRGPAFGPVSVTKA